MKKLIIPMILFIGIGLSAFTPEKSNKELRGDKYFFVYSFDKAIKTYTRVKHLSTEGQRRLAKSYENLDSNNQAEAAYSKLVGSSGEILPEDYYNYAMVLKANNKYEQYGKSMDKFRELKPNDLRAKDYEANKAELNNWLKDNGKYKIEHLNVNTDAEDFGTCYYKDKIVFASSRAKPKFVKKEDNWHRKPFLNIYVSELENGQMKTPKNFDRSLNGSMNEGPASFSKDGNFMAYTKNDYDLKRKELVVKLEIYFRTYADGKWSKPEPFVLNNKAYSVGHPCLAADGKSMYFASDMTGGYGGSDIYRIVKDENGKWGKPENLGDKINTEGDEMFPFFEENSRTLYFSSNGRFGLGGLDIFIGEMVGSGVGRVYNAGAPLNTRYDDFAMIVDGKTGKGYFSSNRIGGSGDDDIYSVELLIKEIQTDASFAVNAPKNIPVERRVRETFPLRNYVFFDLGSTEISDRYVLLKKDQVKDFKEAQLEVFKPKTNSGRAKRQMVIYYNILNILGDRMGKNPSATITLVGSSEKGPDDARLMAESTKKYLVDIFGIKASRISIEGRFLPKLPSEHPGGTLELTLLREGDRRVTIESSSSALLMEFQSGPAAPLKPIEIVGVLDAPPDGFVSFKAEGIKDSILNWSMEITDKQGKVQYFGPYTEETVTIPGKSILGTLSQGTYKVTMVGQTMNGKTVRKDTTLQMELYTPPKTVEMLRFSIIYEFNDSRSIAIYEKYLTNIIIPKIPLGAKVILSGYTDIIGEEANNKKLSLARANDAKDILENGLSKAGRKDVKFEINGFGEDQTLSPFENKYPEERFYNRTVIIDIIPQ